MKPVLVAVWFLLPCDSTVVEDHTTRTTTAIACPNTFREAAGPFLAEGWKPPAVPPFRQGATRTSEMPSYVYKDKPTVKKVKKTIKKKKKKKRKR